MIVDDEPDGIEFLRELIRTFFPQLRNIHTAANLSEAKEIITGQKMDILLLDVQLQEGTIFQLLNDTNLLSDTVLVFVTGYKEYAFEAIKKRPFDYLLKPVSPEEFVTCIGKCLEHLKSRNREKKLLESEDRELVLSESGRYHPVKMSQVLYCKSMGAYTSFHLKSGRKILVSKPMIRFQDELEENQFFRIHNSYIVNMRHIRSVRNESNAHIELLNGESLPLARRRKPLFLKEFRK